MSTDFLRDLGEHIREAAHREASGHARRRGGAPKTAARWTGALLVVVIVAITGAAVLRWAAPTNDERAAPAGRTASDAPTEVAEHFAILRRPVASSDEVPARWVRQFATSGEATQDGRLDFAAARRVTPEGANGAVYWVIPTDGSLCLLEQSGDSATIGCSTNRDALAGRAMSTTTGIGTGLANGERRISGLLPDEAADARLIMSDGVTRALAPDDNVYAAVVARAADRIEWTDATGDVHSVSVSQLVDWD